MRLRDVIEVPLECGGASRLLGVDSQLSGLGEGCGFESQAEASEVAFAAGQACACARKLHGFASCVLIHSASVIDDGDVSVVAIAVEQDTNRIGVRGDGIVNNIRDRGFQGISKRSHGFKEIRVRLAVYCFHSSSPLFAASSLTSSYSDGTLTAIALRGVYQLGLELRPEEIAYQNTQNRGWVCDLDSADLDEYVWLV